MSRISKVNTTKKLNCLVVYYKLITFTLQKRSHYSTVFAVELTRTVVYDYSERQIRW